MDGLNWNLHLAPSRADKVDYAWKIIVCGGGGVGKSTFLHRYFRNEFKENTSMTIGCSHYSEFVERQGKLVNLIIWDLSGQPRFEVLHPAYVGDSYGAFVFFDMTQIDTLVDVNKWVELIRQFNSRPVPIIFVGTKVDLVTEQAMLDHVYRFAEEKMAELDINYICITSSKTNYNVKETLDFFVDYLIWQANQPQ
nr:Rab family GTPase [Candidatus Sigynarchaeota archaeon]